MERSTRNTGNTRNTGHGMAQDAAPERDATWSNHRLTLPPPSQELADRRREILERCLRQTADLKRALLYGMTTSLALQSVPLPRSCDLDTAALHTVSGARERRMRKVGDSRPHVWSNLTDDMTVRVRGGVHALALPQTWAQLAAHVSLADLVMVGDAAATILASEHGLDVDAERGRVIAPLADAVRAAPRFNGRPSCVRALRLLGGCVLSPMETEARLALMAHGLPRPEANHVVPDLAFDSGMPVTLDLAWPAWSVAVEYDGDHHRTDQRQWRRDREKRATLQSRGWTVLEITADTLSTEASRAEFAFRVARFLASRGVQVGFRVTAMPLESLADSLPSELP